MDIAAQLEIHAKQELDHAPILSRQIDYLGKMPVVTPEPVSAHRKIRKTFSGMISIENETVRNYRDRIQRCEKLGNTRWQNEFAKSSCRSRIIKSI